MSGILVISDLHAHAWPRFATTTRDGQNSRFADLMAVLKQVEGYIEREQPDTLVVLGDLTHRRQFVQFSIYTPLSDWLHDVVYQMQTRVVCLVGNHDIESRGHHSLSPLRNMGIDVVDEAMWVELENFGWARMISYMPADGVVLFSRMGKETAPSMTGDPRVAFLHYALHGKVLGEHEYALPSALALGDLDQYDRIVLGHVHAPSIEHDGRVIYVGAPMHFDFGDVGPRYCWHFADAQSAPRALPLYAPQFVTARYPRVPLPPDEHSGFLRVLNAPADVLVDVKRGAIEMGWKDCIVQEAALPREAVRSLVLAAFGDESTMRDFVGQRYAALDDTTREALIAFGSECLREARS